VPMHECETRAWAFERTTDAGSGRTVAGGNSPIAINSHSWDALELKRRLCLRICIVRTDPVADAVAGNMTSALGELEKLARKRPALGVPCGVLAAILPALYGEPVTEPALDVSPQEVRAKLGEAIPLLRDVALPIDERAFRKRWKSVCKALKQPAADALADAVERQSFDLVALLAEVLSTGPDATATTAEALGLDGALTATVLRLTAFPSLAQMTRTFARLREGVVWELGYCPICGSWPLLGETRGLEQDRFLRCGLCASAWQFRRLLCPFCGNQDHRSLGYVYVEGEEDRYRAGTCEVCHGYVKWVSTIFPLSDLQILVADLGTMHLDLAATERGYFVS
jgi:formate dehydrogenase accessory protein FdhE